MCLFIHDGPSCYPQFGAIMSMLLFIFLYVSFGTQRNTFLLGTYWGVEFLVIGYVCIQRQLLFSCWVMSDSLQPHGLQHPRLPCLSLFPRVCSNSCSLSQWCHPTISSSGAFAFSSCLQSFPASRFSNSGLFASGDLSIGASVPASDLPMNIQGWFPLGLTGLISLLFKGLFSSTTVWKYKFFGAQPSLWSNSHIRTFNTGKYHSFDFMNLCQQSNVSAFNTLSMFVIA